MTNSGSNSTRWLANWLTRTPAESPKQVARRKAFQQAFSLGLNVRLIDGALVVLNVHLSPTPTGLAFALA